MGRNVTDWVVAVRVGGIEWDEGSGGRHGGFDGELAQRAAPLRDEGARALVCARGEGVSV